jgi:glycosyltransferase involved in cell wall biosynthesis
MNDPILISVITPVFNKVTYIKDAIESVMAQDYKTWEHVIVDGGSTDGTLEIIKEYPHLKWVSEHDGGQSEAMNKGFNISSGDIIVYLNADDYFLPGAFSAVIPYFEKGAEFVVGKIRVDREDGISWINDARCSREEMLKHWEPQAFCINPAGYFYTRKVQEKAGGFNESNHLSMDLEFLLTCSGIFNLEKMNPGRILGVFRNFRDTKTFNKQSGLRNPWTIENYGFIDKILREMPDTFIPGYKKERNRGYRMRWVSIMIEHTDNRLFYLMWLRMKLFLLSRGKVKLILDFFRKCI